MGVKGNVISDVTYYNHLKNSNSLYQIILLFRMALAKCFAQKGTLENLIFKTGLFKECVILQELTGYIYITLSAGSV